MLEIRRHLSDRPKDSIFGKSIIEEFPDATVATIRSWMQEGGEWVAGLEIMKNRPNNICLKLPPEDFGRRVMWVLAITVASIGVISL